MPRWDGDVNEVCNDYLKSASFEKAANTAVSYAGALQPVRERLGKRKARSITRQDVEDPRDWLLAEGRKRGGKPGTGLGPRSVRLTLGRMTAAFELACQDGHLAVNPARYAKMPSQPKRAGTTWSEEQLRKFLAAAVADRLHACWRLSALGERRGEVLGERWDDDFDADAGTITVNRSRVLADGRVIEKMPKSDRGTRTLPLDADTLAALRSLRKRQREERMAAGAAYEDSGYIAVDERGRPLHPERYSDEFARLCREAGVPVIRLHDARHTVSSLMAAAGVPDHIRAAWCGHTVAVNVATYTHARPEDMAVAGAALSRIVSAM